MNLIDLLPSWFLVNDQRDAQILFYVFIFIFNSLRVSSTSCSSSGETNCVNTTSGLAVSCAGRKWTSDLYTTRSPTQSDSYQRLYWHNLSLLMMSTMCSKHKRVKNKNKYIEKNCASRWSFTKSHYVMHGHQNIKFSNPVSVRLISVSFSHPPLSGSHVLSVSFLHHAPACVSVLARACRMPHLSPCLCIK